MQIKLPHEFTPRPFQRDLYRAFFIEGKKRLIQIIHRRAGKTKTALNLLVGAAMQRVGVYLHVFPELNQARRNVWNNVDKDGRRYLDHIPKSLIHGMPNNTDMRVTLINGSQIQLAGGDRYDKLRGANPLGICFDEFAHMHPNAWYFNSPILRENDGFAFFLYTPQGYNHGYDLYYNNLDNPDWFVSRLDITQTHNNDGTRILMDADIEAERRAGIPEEAIQQEYFVSFESALIGAYYSKELQQASEDGRICDFDIDPKLPVHTAWDLGVRDATAIWLVQVCGQEKRFIHYYENRGESLEHYIKWLDQFLANRNLKPGYHFAPHDIQVRELGSGRSRFEMAMSMGLTFTPISHLSIKDGIDAVRMFFSTFWFHRTNCRDGLNLIKQYRTDDNGKPLHDHSSHAADSLRYFMIGWQDTFRNEGDFVPFEGRSFNPIE